VNISFSHKKLEKWANDYSKGVANMGQRSADVYQKRLGLMRSANTLEDLRHAPGRFHELTGDRKGQWACDLDHPYRLVFEPHEQPIPTNAHGGYDWSAIRGIEVIEIIDYHG